MSEPATVGVTGTGQAGTAADDREMPPVALVHGADATPEQLVRRFAAHVAAGGDWRPALLDAIARWPLAEETLDGARHVYLICGEAFDWRTVADRLMQAPGVDVPEEEWADLLFEAALPGCDDEDEFRRALGVDKYRAHLNYVYGVTVEQALFLAVEEEIRKWRVGAGFAPGDEYCDRVYERLYHAPLDTLLDEFQKDWPQVIVGNGRSRRGRPTLADAEAFTYWLFKRRVKYADPARVASDTRKGLKQLERMRRAQARRRGSAVIA